MRASLAVFGGLFDPVHIGHVNAARFALEFLSAERLKMVPCHVPNHKARPSTAPKHRLAMLEIATESDPLIEIDPIELLRDRISYTVETLELFKREHDRLVFILGVDAFNTLPQWHEWEKILELSHLLVLSRTGSELSAATMNAVGFEARRVNGVDEMLGNNSGKIICREDFDFDMASSRIRAKLAQGVDVATELDAGVVRYIRNNGLYRN